MSEELEQDFTKLSIEERCNHKNWKARLSGYESLTTLFQTLEEKSPEFVKYAPLVKKLVIDSNAAAQEKGLSAVLAFAENYSQAGKYVEGVVGGIIAKCLISPKVKTRELSHEIVLMYVEIEKQEAVIEELIKGLDNKTPKIVAATVSLIKECLNKFGVKVINIKPIVKVIPRLLEDRDKNVREEGKQLSIEVYRWIKDAIKPQLQNLKPVQLQELEGEFEKVKDEKAIQTRLLRSQQTRVEYETAVDQTDGNVASAMPEEEVAIDPYDLLEPVDILSKLPNDFYELCEAKKWQERKESLEKLQELLEKNPKLVPGDYADLVRQLKKMIGKDTNIMVVTLSTKCLALLATALRKSFHPYANSCISVIIEKFKEKKQNVVIALREAIDAIILATSIENILEDLTTALDNKNPQIKSETALFLARTFCYTHPNVLLNKKLLKNLCAALTKSLNDMDSTVRDSSAEALGTAMKVVSEKTITPFLQGVEAIKLNKIKEFCDKAQVKIPATAVVPSVPSKPPAVKRIAPNVPIVAKTSSQESLDGSFEELDKEPKPVKKKVLTKSAAEKSKNSIVTKPQTNGSSNNISSNSEQLPNSQTALNNNKSKFLVKNKNSRQTVSAPNKTTKKTEEIVSNSPLMPLNKMKDQRLADEKALKVLKWNFTAPREEFYVQLKEQMINADWQMSLINFCFHYDFKNHIKAIDLMKEFLSNGNVEATFANCDLILKWIALRFFDTNPSVILKALEYLLLIFDAYQSNNNALSDAEANSFIPYLVLKSGDPKDAVRNKVHDIISKLREIYAPSKIFNHLMTGLQSKNSRQRATCLDELANLIELCGMIVCQSNVSLTMKEIAKFIADRDNGVRNAALNCVVQVYFIEGEKVYKHVGQLSDKDSSLLEERIKRAAKTRLPVIPPQSAPAAVNTSKAAVVPEKNERTRTPSPPNTRTITKSVASAKSARQRPKSMGPLSLDLEQIEQQLGTNTKRRTPPKNMSINHRSKEIYVDDNDIDIDEILNLPDVQIRKSIVQPSLGPMTKMINSSPKADVALNLVMAQLSSQEISSAMEALSQLSQLLDNEAKAEAVLESKVDQLIIMCYMQYRLFLTKHLADQSLPKTEVINLFRGVTNVLMSLFSKPSLGKKASRDVLRELMSHMVALLVDSKLIELSDSANIIRSVNVLATTVINGSDPTNMLSALIKLLHDCISNSINASPKFMEMIMKCLWKMSRNLDNYIEDIEIDRIFLEVHLFLKSFPSLWWKDNHKDDTPLRTIKTLTYLIVQQKGDSVLNHLTLIRDRNESELCHYIQKALKQSDRLLNAGLKLSQKTSPKIPKTAHNQLVSIISKLGTDDNNNGLIELYEFTQSYPQIPIEPYLEKSSDFFKGFVINGLQKIRYERERAQTDTRITQSNGSSPGTSSGLKKTIPLSRVPPPQSQKEAIEWLKTATANFGLDPNKYNDFETDPNLNSNDAINSIEAAEMAVQKAQETLEKFKKAYANGQRR